MSLPPLTLLHFNDVYEIAARSAEPCGGAARFVHMLARLRTAAGTGAVLTLFSGDALSPSLMSTVTRGKHMVPVLNAAHVSAACMGNHEGDFGMDNFAAVAAKHAFPWIISNAVMVADGLPLGGCKEYAVLTAGAWKVGVLGLIESEWLETMATIDPSQVIYEDYLKAAQRLVPILRDTHGCNLIVALTHMRVPNDTRLAMAVEGVDIILGGHDHSVVMEPNLGGNGVPLIKSGSDFRNVSRIIIGTSAQDVTTPPGAGAMPGVGLTLSPPHSKRYHISCVLYEVTSAEPEDAHVAAVVQEHVNILGKKMEAVIGVCKTPLDCRFGALRTSETNAGNFVADLMRQAVDADIAILNSGTLRADSLLGPGILRMKDLVALLPMQDSIVKLRAPGRRILQALENSVTAWPATEGRFAQVSGIRFEFDGSKPPGSRVIRSSVQVLQAHSADEDEEAAGEAGSAEGASTEGHAFKLSSPGVPATSVIAASLRAPHADMHTNVTIIETREERHATGRAACDDASGLQRSVSAPTSLGGVAGSVLSVASKNLKRSSGHVHEASIAEEDTPSPHTANEVETVPTTSGVTFEGEDAEVVDNVMERPRTSHHEHLSRDMSPSNFVLSPSGKIYRKPAPAPHRERFRCIVEDQLYTIATKSYVLHGKDGYDCFSGDDTQVLIGEDDGPVLPTVIRNHFRILAALSGMSKRMDASHPYSPLQSKRMQPHHSVVPHPTSFVRASQSEPELSALDDATNRRATVAVPRPLGAARSNLFEQADEHGAHLHGAAMFEIDASSPTSVQSVPSSPDSTVISTASSLASAVLEPGSGGESVLHTPTAGDPAAAPAVRTGVGAQHHGLGALTISSPAQQNHPVDGSLMRVYTPIASATSLPSDLTTEARTATRVATAAARVPVVAHAPIHLLPSGDLPARADIVSGVAGDSDSSGGMRMLMVPYTPSHQVIITSVATMAAAALGAAAAATADVTSVDYRAHALATASGAATSTPSPATPAASLPESAAQTASDTASSLQRARPAALTDIPVASEQQSGRGYIAPFVLGMSPSNATPSILQEHASTVRYALAIAPVVDGRIQEVSSAVAAAATVAPT